MALTNSEVRCLSVCGAANQRSWTDLEQAEIPASKKRSKKHQKNVTNDLKFINLFLQLSRALLCCLRQLIKYPSIFTGVQAFFLSLVGVMLVPKIDTTPGRTQGRNTATRYPALIALRSLIERWKVSPAVGKGRKRHHTELRYILTGECTFTRHRLNSLPNIRQLCRRVHKLYRSEGNNAERRFVSSRSCHLAMRFFVVALLLPFP